MVTPSSTVVKTPDGYRTVSGGGGFVSGNVVIVPWTGLSNSGGNYFVQLGAPQDLNGDAAVDWQVIPGTPGSSSDQIVSPTRTGVAWWAQACLQCGPEANVRRAFLSAFNPGPVGVTGCASGFQGNNDRANAVIFYGGLQPTISLFFQLNWNGVTPLSLNSGDLMILSS